MLAVLLIDFKEQRREGRHGNGTKTPNLQLSSCRWWIPSRYQSRQRRFQIRPIKINDYSLMRRQRRGMSEGKVFFVINHLNLRLEWNCGSGERSLNGLLIWFITGDESCAGQDLLNCELDHWIMVDLRAHWANDFDWFAINLDENFIPTKIWAKAEVKFRSDWEWKTQTVGRFQLNSVHTVWERILR